MAGTAGAGQFLRRRRVATPFSTSLSPRDSGRTLAHARGSDHGREHQNLASKAMFVDLNIQQAG
jgi:hypothetical protein